VPSQTGYRRLIYARTLKFAHVQAKLRARIGKLPGEHTWRALALNPAGELLDGLEGIGVDFWLRGLPENVSRDGLERHFMGRIRVLLRRVGSWLPREWDEFRSQLILAPDVFWLAPVLAGEDPGTRLDADSELQRAARAAPAQRRGVLEQTSFAGFLERSERPEIVWRNELLAAVPRLACSERRPVERLRKVLDAYHADKSAEFERLAGQSEPAARRETGEAGHWSRHRSLEEKLYSLLAGDPFHPALILIYALLELLTMEKLRALLLCRLLGWSPPAALTGRA